MNTERIMVFVKLPPYFVLDDKASDALSWLEFD